MLPVIPFTVTVMVTTPTLFIVTTPQAFTDSTCDLRVLRWTRAVQRAYVRNQRISTPAEMNWATG